MHIREGDREEQIKIKITNKQRQSAWKPEAGAALCVKTVWSPQ